MDQGIAVPEWCRFGWAGPGSFIDKSAGVRLGYGPRFGGGGNRREWLAKPPGKEVGV